MNQDTLDFFTRYKSAQKIIYKPCQTAQEVIKESRLPYLPIIGFKIPHQEMFEEARKLIPMMVSHRSNYEDHQGWKSLVLHGLGATKTEGAERYGLNPEDPSIYQWTEIASLAPVTTEFFRDHFKYHFYQRIRFMLLEPGGYVCPHTDFDHYTLGPVNIALNNPQGCQFVMKDFGPLPFKAGSIMKLALVNEHAVVNNSTEPRIHMIVHGSPHPDHWRHVIMNSYQSFITEPGLEPI